MASFSLCMQNTVNSIFRFILGVKCDVLWDSREQVLNEQQIWISRWASVLPRVDGGRGFLAEYGSCCSTLAEQCIVLDMINRCEQPAFNCLLLTWRCLTEGKESPLGLSTSVCGCRRVCVRVCHFTCRTRLYLCSCWCHINCKFNSTALLTLPVFISRPEA